MTVATAVITLTSSLDTNPPVLGKKHQHIGVRRRNLALHFPQGGHCRYSQRGFVPFPHSHSPKKARLCDGLGDSRPSENSCEFHAFRNADGEFVRSLRSNI